MQRRKLCLILISAGLVAATALWHRSFADASFIVPEGTIVNLAWSPDGKSLAYCTYGDVFGNHAGCRLIDASSGALETNFPRTQNPIAGHGDGVLGFVTPRTLLLPALWNNPNGFITLWNTTNGQPEGAINLPPDPKIADQSAASLSLAGNRRSFAAMRGGLYPVYLYNLPSLNLLQTFSPHADHGVDNIALSAGGDFLAIANGQNAVETYDTKTGQRLGEADYNFDPQISLLTATAFSPDDRHLAVGFQNWGPKRIMGANNQWVTLPTPWPMAPIYIWPLRNGAPFGQAQQICGKQDQGVLNMVWVPNGKAIIFTDNVGNVVSCPLTGTPGTVLLQRDLNAVQIPAISPDGTKLAVAADNQITVISLKP